MAVAAKKTASAEPAPKRDPNMCIVFCKADIHKARIHHIQERPYEIHATKPCYIPMQDAVFFLKDPAFTVIAPDGTEMKARLTGPIDRSKKLEKHETIATYHELRDDALLARCHALPGGVAINKNTPRERKIDFLITEGFKDIKKVEAEKPAPAVEAEPGDPVVEMDEDGGGWLQPPEQPHGAIGGAQGGGDGDVELSELM